MGSNAPEELASQHSRDGRRTVASANVDLVVAIACVAVEALLVGLLPDAAAPRAVLGAVTLLVVPGYVLSVALFPAGGELSGTARVALSVALSLAVVALLGLALNFLPWGLHVGPVLTGVVMMSTATAALAVLRRRSVMAPGRAWTPSRPISARPLSVIAAALSLIVLGGGVAIAALSAQHVHKPAGFTVFYLLDGTRPSEPPPIAAPGGMPFRLVVGVENHEGRPVRYLLTASVDGQPLKETRIPTVLSGATWRRKIQIRVPSKRPGRRVDFELRLPGSPRPYRRLSLPIDSGAIARTHPRGLGGVQPSVLARRRPRLR